MFFSAFEKHIRYSRCRNVESCRKLLIGAPQTSSGAFCQRFGIVPEDRYLCLYICKDIDIYYTLYIIIHYAYIYIHIIHINKADQDWDNRSICCSPAVSVIFFVPTQSCRWQRADLCWSFCGFCGKWPIFWLVKLQKPSGENGKIYCKLCGSVFVPPAIDPCHMGSLTSDLHQPLPLRPARWIQGGWHRTMYPAPLCHEV